ncbi:hypothetical protein GBA52_024675 [Prunus armeniaca]|nr:hypothetical protein GBA52_024675 [Prunus armeniaca]
MRLCLSAFVCGEFIRPSVSWRCQFFVVKVCILRPSGDMGIKVERLASLKAFYTVRVIENTVFRFTCLSNISVSHEQ